MDSRMDRRRVSSTLHVKTHGLQCASLTLGDPPVFLAKVDLYLTA